MKVISSITKLNLLFLFKTGIGSAMAILLASSFGFLYSPSAGIITLLTIQNTTKETISIAQRRFAAFILAVIISYTLFENLGYTPIAFGFFVFFFVAFCFLLQLKDGIAMNSVLMTHFLIEKRMDLPLLLNEFGLLVIGMGIGIIFNLIMPKNKKRIRKEQLLLESEIKVTLWGLASMLKEKDACLIQTENNTEFLKHVDYKREELDFVKVETMLEKLLKSAYEEVGNTLLSDTRYLVTYLEMRKLQVGVLKDIKEDILSVPVLLRQTFPMADFIETIAESFHERNNVIELLKKLEDLKEFFKQDKLPKTRDEFEYRAILFQILKELEYFLKLKRDFILEIDSKNMNSYWD